MDSRLHTQLRLSIQVPCPCSTSCRIALYLLKDNPGEVLRRLAVICVEDAVLPPAYPALVSQASRSVQHGTALTAHDPFALFRAMRGPNKCRCG